MMNIHYCYFDSPLGKLLIAGDYQGLRILNFQDGPNPHYPERDWRRDAAFFVNPIMQLKEYFAGKRTRFSLRLNPIGTEFQRNVLDTVMRIPYGDVANYADIARMLKKPRAVRAVGAANRNNPLPIFIPCHRVIGSNGTLTGYVGGLERKKWLLKHESCEMEFEEKQGQTDFFGEIKEREDGPIEA